MSNSATSTSGATGTQSSELHSPAGDKGKGRVKEDHSMEEEDDEEDEEEEEEEEEEDDEMEVEEDYAEIDPSAILPTRRTRGKRVDYSSAEALAKAGLKPETEEEKEEEDFEPTSKE